MKSLIVLQFLFAFSYSALPPTFKKCQRKQSDFDACLKAAVNDAITQLNKPFDEIRLANIDPLEIPSFSVPPSNGAASFAQEYENFKVLGVSKCNCREVNLSLVTKKYSAKCFCPKLDLVFDYEFKGKLIVLQFAGKGPGNMTLVKPELSITYDFEEYEKKGKTHYKVVENSFTMDPEKIIFKFENIFGEDKAVNDNLNQVFNDNWDVIYDDVRKSYEDVLAQVLKQVLGRMLAKVSIDEVFGDE